MINSYYWLDMSAITAIAEPTATKSPPIAANIK